MPGSKDPKGLPNRKKLERNASNISKPLGSTKKGDKIDTTDIKIQDAKYIVPENDALSEVPELEEEQNGHEGSDSEDSLVQDEVPNLESDEEEEEDVVQVGTVTESGDVEDDDGTLIGHVRGSPTGLSGSAVSEAGEIISPEGDVIGHADTLDEDSDGSVDTLTNDDATLDEEQSELGAGENMPLEDIEEESGLEEQDGEGEVAEALDSAAETTEEAQLPDISILEGLAVNKAGMIVSEDGTPVGKLISGDGKKLAGKLVDAEGRIWDNAGKQIGQAEPLAQVEENEPAPFEDFPGAIVDKSGQVLFESQPIGRIVEGDVKKMVGKTVDSDGDVLDKHGNVLGKAERLEDESEPEEEPAGPDFSVLAGKRVNKAGNVCGDSGAVEGRVVQGVLKNLIGKKCDENGEIWNDAGAVIGKAEPIPDNEREEVKEAAAFEDFPGAVVQSNGDVVYEGSVVGKVVEGDAKKLHGKHVDQDGDICDKSGNVLGKAERWEEEEVEAAPEIDNSSLAGLRVNKAGNVVDKSGDIFGRVIEGDVKLLANRMCDKLGFVRNDGGDVIGKAQVILESEREGLKEGPFTGFPGCTVAKDGKVVTPANEVVGRLKEGDAKKLFGRAVDVDGDICDSNGTVLGTAERWEEEEVVKDVSIMAGRKVNKEGDVYNDEGEHIGKLTDGELRICVGKRIDDDDDVVDSKGKTIGHVTLLEDIVEPEPEVEVDPETAEEKQLREQQAIDKKLAGQLSSVVENGLDQVKPILNQITMHLDKASRTAKEELDEEEVVKTVKPLIEEGGRILSETNSTIRALDPDGRIATQAKLKSSAHEATPEEYRLADLLKELTGEVHQTIENAKAAIEDMPHAKKELNPLWGLLSEPLAQIIAAVGLLLSGVLGLVGKLLNGLGLGGILNGLLGGLGITNLLDGLGLGSIVSGITGK